MLAAWGGVKIGRSWGAAARKWGAKSLGNKHLQHGDAISVRIGIGGGFHFLLLDPAAAPAADPRPTFPAVFYDPPAGRIVAHSNWSSTNTMFDYHASWISINHQLGDGGQFELYRKGEWLTKEMSNYDNNAVGVTTVYHNTLALQNVCTNGKPATLQWYESGEWANGSQWMEGMDAGDPKTVMSTGLAGVYKLGAAG